MVWSIETDDFRGNCGMGKNPLIRYVSERLMIPQPPTTTVSFSDFFAVYFNPGEVTQGMNDPKHISSSFSNSRARSIRYFSVYSLGLFIPFTLVKKQFENILVTFVPHITSLGLMRKYSDPRKPNRVLCFDCSKRVSFYDGQAPKPRLRNYFLSVNNFY